MTRTLLTIVACCALGCVTVTKPLDHALFSVPDIKGWAIKEFMQKGTGDTIILAGEKCGTVAIEANFGGIIELESYTAILAGYLSRGATIAPLGSGDTALVKIIDNTTGISMDVLWNMPLDGDDYAAGIISLVMTQKGAMLVQSHWFASDDTAEAERICISEVTGLLGRIKMRE
jgi:hypothetical protein